MPRHSLSLGYRPASPRKWGREHSEHSPLCYSLELLELLFHYAGMAVNLDLSPDMGYPPLWVDEKGGSDDAIALFAIHPLQSPGPVGLCDPVIRITQEEHLQAMLGSELLVACGRVPADASHLSIKLLKLREVIGEVQPQAPPVVVLPRQFL